jgi:cytoskeletal protein RodZ
MRIFSRTVPDLAVLRANRGVSLEQIARATKISVFYLQAIENGEIGKLPGGIYTKSYVRQYARAIDYNEQELLERF